MPARYDLDTLLDKRFIKIFKRKSVKGEFGCLDWIGQVNSHGYGTFRVNQIPLIAHRIAWIIHHRRPIDAELVIDHLCCNTRCVNPRHLEAITDTENMGRINNPPPGWIRIGGHYGTRRKYVTQKERRQMGIAV